MASAAARFAVIVDLPTPPLPEPTHTTFETCASAPAGSAPRPSFCWRPAFSLSERTSKATFTRVTPSRAPTAERTAFSKWLRMGQPGVVSETVTSTVPSGRASIDRTISSSTIERRSSGSMTAVSAWRISSRVGMRSILANGWGCPNGPAGQKRTGRLEGGPFSGRRGTALPARYEADSFRRSGSLRGGRRGSAGLRARLLCHPRDALDGLGGDLRAGGDAGLHEVLDARAHEVRLRAGVAASGAERANVALDALAALAELALEAVARDGAAALELAQLTLDLVERVVLGGELDDVVAGDEGGADRDRDRTAGEVDVALDRRALQLAAGLGGLLRGGRALARLGRLVARTSGGGLLGGRRAVGRGGLAAGLRAVVGGGGGLSHDRSSR